MSLADVSRDVAADDQLGAVLADPEVRSTLLLSGTPSWLEMPEPGDVALALAAPATDLQVVLEPVLARLELTALPALQLEKVVPLK